MPRKSMVIPAILAESREEFAKKLNLIKTFSSDAQLDIMNGTFVQQKSWTDPFEIEKMNPGNLNFELHLMVDSPVLSLAAWGANKNVKKAVAHIETFKNPLEQDGGVREFLEACKAFSWEAGLAINPDTDTQKLESYLKLLDFVLFMGVEPGKSGQKMDQCLPEKITNFVSRFKKSHAALPSIEVDGGINESNAASVCAAGASKLIAGSYIFNSKNPKAAFEKLSEICRN